MSGSHPIGMHAHHHKGWLTALLGKCLLNELIKRRLQLTKVPFCPRISLGVNSIYIYMGLSNFHPTRV